MERLVGKLIAFIFIYILVVLPLTLVTEEEFFPFSRFPMYASNTLEPCGYQIHLLKNDENVALKKYRAGNLFLKYSREVIEKKGGSNGEMCQFIKDVFWPKNLPYESFYVKRYCSRISNLPVFELDEKVSLICRL